MEQPGDLGLISKRIGGCYLEVQWQTSAASAPLINPSPSLLPFTAFPSPFLSTCHQAVSCLLNCRHTDQPGDGMHGRDGKKDGKTKRENWQIQYEREKKSWRCKPSLSALANNRRDQFLWTLIHPVSVFFFLPVSEYKENPKQKHCSLNPVNSPAKETEREKE